MTNDELAAMILPWAKEHHPDKYATTLQMVSKPATFRRCMTRLVEIRWEADLAWRRTLPLSLLEETAIVATFRDRKTGVTFDVKGRLAEGERVWGFDELGLTREAFETRLAVKAQLDLVRER